MKATITRSDDSKVVVPKSEMTEEEKALAEAEEYDDRERTKRVRRLVADKRVLEMERDIQALKQGSYPQSGAANNDYERADPEILKTLAGIDDDEKRDKVADCYARYEAGSGRRGDQGLLHAIIDQVNKGGVQQSPVTILKESLETFKEFKELMKPEESEKPPTIVTQPERSTLEEEILLGLKDDLKSYISKSLRRAFGGERGEEGESAPTQLANDRRDFQLKESIGMVIPSGMTYQEATEMNEKLWERKQAADKEKKDGERWNQLKTEGWDEAVRLGKMYGEALVNEKVANIRAQTAGQGAAGQPGQGPQPDEQFVEDGALTCQECGTKIPVDVNNLPEVVECPNKKTPQDKHLYMTKTPG